MQQVTQFVINHWVLSLLAVVISVWLIWDIITGRRWGGIWVEPSEVSRLINHDHAVVIDLRDQSDFNGGHILGAVHVPVRDLKARAEELLAKYPDRPLIMSCRTGSFSGEAAKLLRKAGIEKVYQLRGGVSAWQTASYPLEKK